MPKRRVVICTHASIYASLFIIRFLRSDDVEIVGIINSSRVLKKKETWLRSVYDLIQHSGISYALMLFFVTSLFDVVSLFGRLKAVSTIARQNNIDLLTTSDINRPECIHWLQEKKPDLIVSVFFNQIIGEEVTVVPTIAAINVHPSLLPDYRGVDPVFYMLLDKQQQGGFSVHYIAPDIDQGNIIRQQKVELSTTVLFSGYCRLFSRSADTVISIITSLTSTDVGQQQPSTGRYDSWPTSALVKRFKREGNRLISLKSYLKIARGID